MNKDAVVIGGMGVVGKATRRMLDIDQYWDLAEFGGITLEALSAKQYLFLCLPTPTIEGVCDISRLRYYVNFLGKDHTYIIRSTVPPGTARGLSEEYGVAVVSCPEFLTEATADTDCVAPNLLVLGSDDPELGARVYHRFFSRVNAETVISTDTVTAETIKYAINVFYATKTLFANALYDVAQGLGIDYGVVVEAMYARKWVGRNHLTVPWKGTRGVTGRCLPKDLAAFAAFSSHPFFEYLVAENTRQTRGNDA